MVRLPTPEKAGERLTAQVAEPEMISSNKTHQTHGLPL